MLIRLAQVEDAPAIARVHVDGWRSTYKGIMPDTLLAGLSYERAAEIRVKQLQEADPSIANFVAEVDGQVVAFAIGGPERSNDPLYKGELYAIYSLDEYKGRGIGRALFEAVVRHLVAHDFDTMLLWVASANPTRHFYEHLGGQALRTKFDSFGTAEVEETAYGWRALQSWLAANTNN